MMRVANPLSGVASRERRRPRRLVSYVADGDVSLPRSLTRTQLVPAVGYTAGVMKNCHITQWNQHRGGLWIQPANPIVPAIVEESRPCAVSKISTENWKAALWFPVAWAGILFLVCIFSPLRVSSLGDGGKVVVHKQGVMEQVMVYGQDHQIQSQAIFDQQGGTYGEYVRFFQELQDVLRNGDAQAIAGMLAYPMEIRGGVSSWHVHTADDLVANFAQVFEPGLAREILSADPRNLERHSSGVTFARGSVTAKKSTGRIRLCRIVQTDPEHGMMVSAQRWDWPGHE